MESCSEKTMATDDNATTTITRKDKRKLLKKEKRKQLRKEIALREKQEEETRLNDTEEQAKLRQLEQDELHRMERDRIQFEERERRFLEALELKKKREQEEYEEEQRLAQESRAKQVEEENLKEMDEGSDWEYVEEGPAEIIWQGNEIIVKKNKVRVPKKNLEQRNKKEDVVRPISNPLAPQSEAFENHKSAQDILDTVAQQVPNFGTEQDKAHCPFHLKTGACRFGTRCSRVHFYPDKSCTLLMKNMYGGPGLVWEQDEGLEYTDEEIEHSFEEFYEDVHTEFLKFGEIVNFKVCRNGSPHLRGNVYVHYKSLEYAVLAYRSTNGRYFAGKQIICEFINLTRWKVAICGEFMKSRLKRCSRGSACNFIHCFRNPGGDYEWADWDRPPPRYWVKKMAALFGYEGGYDKQLDEGSPDPNKTISAAKRMHMDADRCHSRSRSREPDSRRTRTYDDKDDRKSKGQQWRHIREERDSSLDRDRNEEKMHGNGDHYIRGKSPNVYSDDDQSDRELRRINHEAYYPRKKSHRRSRWQSKDRNSVSDSDRDNSVKDKRESYREDHRSHRRSKRHRHHNGNSLESDSDREGSGKDGRERGHKDRTRSRQKKRDSCNTEYECGSKEENHNDPEGHSYDYHGDTRVKNGEGYHVKRRKSSRWSNNEMDCSDHDVRDSFDRYEEEYDKHTTESSKLESKSKKTDLSERSHGFHKDKYGKRENSEHRKRERSHKSERRSSRRHGKDGVGSKAMLSDKEEGSERTHKGRKGSSWDQNKVEDHVVTAHEGHHEREACDERHNAEKQGKLDDAETDEENGGRHTSPQKTRSGEIIGDGHLNRQEDCVELEVENEQACRRAALEKLEEKQLQKQPSSNSSNLMTPKTSSINVEGSVAISKVDEDQNDIEAEPRKRRRI